MRRTAAKTWAGVVGALGVLTLSLGAASPATASTDAGEAPTKVLAVDRVIDRTSEFLPLNRAALNTLATRTQSVLTGASTEQAGLRSTTATAALPLPAGVTLDPGETVRVNYSDGVATHQMVSASCKITDSVQNPYVDGGYAWSYHTYGKSAGCAGNTSINGILSSYAAPWWHQRDFTTETTQPNQTTYWATDAKCKNKTKSKWHSENVAGTATTSLSPDTTIACNYG